ncbi:MAG: hypothetical protein HFG26_13515 [Provencibacterium sp.]|jgi:hypothetical protein|nr:hypothetical protein [Provencibacterium sp.]
MTLESLKTLPTGQLLDIWEITGKIKDLEISTVRGWLMDEMERRNPVGFNAWLNRETPADEALRWHMEMNPLCLSCLCLGDDCGGMDPEPWTGCIYRKTNK